jgi:NAD(P)-dependent dehydrogenase (short-subunit alcohol dehydrogenase family)
MRTSRNVGQVRQRSGNGRTHAEWSTATGTHAAVVLGARNLGAAITRDLLDRGLRVATVARTRADLDPLAGDGAIAFQADAADAEQLGQALSAAAAQIGPLDLIVNAVSAVSPPGDGSGFGGGPLPSASMAGFEGWTVPAARQAFVALKIGASALSRRGGTIIQVVGAPARRANAGRGLIAAGGAAVRALTHAAAQELRAEGIHVALLIVDGIIASPKTAKMTRGMAPEALVLQEDVIQAVTFLAAQSPRGMTHELVITPAGDRWLP